MRYIRDALCNNCFSFFVYFVSVTKEQKDGETIFALSSTHEYAAYNYAYN